jgi:hypothetical protein
MTETTTAAAHSQPSQALHLANRVRRARSELKTRIADGQLSAAEVILSCPSEITSMPNRPAIGESTWLGQGDRTPFIGPPAVRAGG